SSASEYRRRTITRTSTSTWAIGTRSVAPTVRHGSASIHDWGNWKPIRPTAYTPERSTYSQDVGWVSCRAAGFNLAFARNAGIGESVATTQRSQFLRDRDLIATCPHRLIGKSSQGIPSHRGL